MKIYLCTPRSMSAEQVQKLWHSLRAKQIMTYWNTDPGLHGDLRTMLDCDAIFMAPGWRDCRFAKHMYKTASMLKMRIYDSKQMPIIKV